MTRTALLFAAMAVSCTNGEIKKTNACETDFYKTLDAGQINSINGLAVQPHFAGIFLTELVDGRARIAQRECRHGRLQDARPVFEPHAFHDYQPTLSLDGERLYFTSTRPISGSEAARQNVWYATKQSGWSNAAPIHRLVSPLWDGHAVETAPHTILFASERPGDGQMVDIFSFDLEDERATPVRVVSLNSQKTDNDMAFDRRSRALIFSRYDPESEDIDLYISLQTEDGWMPARILSSLATPKWEMSPAFTPDGNYLLYKTGDGPFRRILMSEIVSSIRR